MAARLTLFLVVLLSLAGCLQDLAGGAADRPQSREPMDPGTNDRPRDGTSATASIDDQNGSRVEEGQGLDMVGPIRVSPPEAYAFEPGLEAGPDGTLVITAAHGFQPQGQQAASWLWWSDDGGRTWAPLESPGQVHTRTPGLEGDLVVTPAGDIWFVDTSLADQSIHRWQIRDGRPVWQTSRPLIGSPTVDDRPWLVSSGSEVLFLVTSNGAATPSPTPSQDVQDSRIWSHVSRDGGRTFEPSRAFPNALWCEPAVHPQQPTSAVIGCSELEDGYQGATDVSGPGQQVAWTTRDGGRTWHRSLISARSTNLTGASNWATTAMDASGAVYHAWADDTIWDDEPGRLRLGVRLPGSAWTVQDLTPFEGSFYRAWVDAGASGRVAIAFYATVDVSPDEETEWYPYVLTTSDSGGEGSSWTLTRLDENATGTRRGGSPPADYLEADVGPDGRVHVAWARHDEGRSNGGIVLYAGERG